MNRKQAVFRMTLAIVILFGLAYGLWYFDSGHLPQDHHWYTPFNEFFYSGIIYLLRFLITFTKIMIGLIILVLCVSSLIAIDSRLGSS